MQERGDLKQSKFSVSRFQIELQQSPGRELRSPRFADKLSQSGGIDARLLREANLYNFALAIDANHADAFAKQLQRCGVEQVANWLRQRAIAVCKLCANICQLIFAFYSRNALVHAQALVLLLNVFIRKAEIEGEIELRAHALRQIFAFQFTNRPLEQRGVHFEADGFDLPALFAAEKVSRTT